jgi:hypothetical protein
MLVLDDEGADFQASTKIRMLRKKRFRLVCVFRGCVLPTMAVPKPRTKQVTMMATNMVAGEGINNGCLVSRYRILSITPKSNLAEENLQ